MGFIIGDRVKIKSRQFPVTEHAPAYLRGKVGTIISMTGGDIFPYRVALAEGIRVFTEYELELVQDEPVIIEPIANYILVRCNPVKAQEIVSPAPPESLQRGEVIAIGPEVSGLHKGDNVLFGKYAGIDAENDLLLIRQKDILAKFTI